VKIGKPITFALRNVTFILIFLTIFVFEFGAWTDGQDA